jgi:hypothetical protein
MGFTNRTLNQSILQRHGYNVDLTVEELLQMQQQQQQNSSSQ